MMYTISVNASAVLRLAAGGPIGRVGGERARAGPAPRPAPPPARLPAGPARAAPPLSDSTC